MRDGGGESVHTHKPNPLGRVDISSLPARRRRAHHVLRSAGYLAYWLRRCGRSDTSPIFEQRRECHINELFVRKDAGRQGNAIDLLETIEAWERTNDCEWLDLTIDVDDTAANTLFEREGYPLTRYNMKKRIESNK